jgi:CHASE3 domain sensor protein
MNNYPFDVFNPNYIASYNQQARELQKHHAEQQKNICDLVKAIRDFIDAMNKVSPEYHDAAMEACFAEIIRQMNQSNGGQQR